MHPPILTLVEVIRKNAKRGMVVAEVGVWEGDTSIYYLPIVKENKGKFIAVDWFCGNTNAQGYHAYKPDNADVIYQNLLSNVKNVDCSDIITVHRGDSVEMAANISDASLDICFIDANHSYDGCKQDILAYLPKVKPGGILCGHDCEDIKLANSFTPEQLHLDWYDIPSIPTKGCHPGVIQAVYEVFGHDVEVIYETSDNPIANRTPIWVKQL